jgi:DNA-binding NarL/FixJ family response regulator
MVRCHGLLELIGHAKDGVDAIHQAELLRPELITLDIGLPKLHGIAAAVQIRRILPRAKILFVTQESEPEVVRECLNLGMCGYVLKPHAGRELPRALDALLAGKAFLGQGLNCYGPSVA